MNKTFYFTIKQASIPAPPSFLSHHSLLIKWKCGQQSGKLPLVQLKGSVDTTLRVPSIAVDFPPSVKVTLETTVTTVTLDLILIRHTDARREHEKGRELIASHIPFSLSGTGSRLGVPQNGMVMVGRHGYVSIEYSMVQGDETTMGGSERADEGMPDLIAPSSNNEGLSTPGGLESVNVPEDEDVFTVADSVLLAGIASCPGVGSVANTYTIVNEGFFKASLFETPPNEVASILFFPSSERSVWDAFHILREDDPPDSKPWRFTPDKRCAFRTCNPKLRYGKGSKKIAATEQCFVCRIEEDYVSRTIVYSSDVPMVGTAVKLDILFHITPDAEGGSVIATFVHVSASDMAKRLGGSMIGKYVEKIMAKAQEALSGLLVTRRLQGRERGRKSYQNMKFRSSVSSAVALSSSLDPCLWRRLVAADTLPNKELVYQYLSRLLTIKVLRVTETQVSAIESVIVYHRDSVPVVSACCNLLLLLCRASSFVVVHKFSPTMWPTLESVFSLHNPGTFQKYQDLVAHLSRHQRQRQREREDQISREHNVWDLFEGIMGERDLVEKCLRTAAGTRNAQLTLSQVQSLTKALSLHMQSEIVVRCALQIISRAHGTIHLLPASTVSALVIGAETHSLTEEFADTLSQLDKRSHSLTHFERQFDTLNEKHIFHCKGWMTGPRIASIHVYMTASYLVIGAFVLPIDSIHKVVPYRSLTLREGIRVIMSANHDDYFVVLSKRRELLSLLDKRKVTIEPPLEDY